MTDTGANINAGDRPDATDSYTRKQMVLHWMIVVLLLIQFTASGAMSTAFETAVEQGAWPPSGIALMHALTGSLVGILMLGRLYIRLTTTTPPPPPGLDGTVSRATHWAFYALLIGMPIFGLLAAWTLSEALATIHYFAGWLLLALIAAHFAGAMWHLWKGDGIAKRMLRDDPAHSANL